MAEHKKHELEHPEIESQEHTDVPKEHAPTPKKSPIGTGLTLFIALCALGSALYSIQYTMRTQKIQAQHASDQSAAVTELMNARGSMQESITAMEARAQQKLQGLQETMNTQTAKVQALLSQPLLQKDDWILLKARYYLELAEINAHWNAPTPTTAALLQQADTLLQPLNTQKLMAIRQTLAKEIALLKAMQQVDTMGILSQLDAAQAMVNTLNVKTPYTTAGLDTKKQNPTPQNTPAWRMQLQKSIATLEQLVVIRRQDEAIEPLISPLYEAMVRENIRMSLQQAQWAVLNSNQAVYQWALNQALHNTQNTFNQQDTNTTSFLRHLTQLQHINLTPKKPEIGAALPLLNQLIDNPSVHTAPAANTEQGAKQP